MDALRLLRIPFSFFLMPVFWFAWSNSAGLAWHEVVLVFVVLHVFVYPASNGYNSYFDRDEGSIGGMKHPPKVTRSLFYWVIAFDLLGLGTSLLLSWQFAAMIAAYMLVSKAYSWDRIRLKAYPVVSTVVVTVFQGAFTYLAVQVGFGMGKEVLFHPANLLLAASATLLLAGNYPLTQVFQHEEDAQRGDRTLSLLLGIKGTFRWSAAMMLVGSGMLCGVYLAMGMERNALIYLGATAPVVGYFTVWISRVWKDEAFANFEWTMRLNAIGSVCTSAAFLLMGLLAN